MEKYKLKKIKLTNFERNILLILIFFVVIIAIFIPIDLHDNLTFNKPHSYEKALKEISFPGNKEEAYIFDNYVSMLYKNDDKYETHFVDLKNNEELFLGDLIKPEKKSDFYKKIHELLLLKYPKSIVTMLEEKAEKVYFFKDEVLSISYPNFKYGKKDSFSLNVSYNEIKDMLIFNTNESDIQNESGYNIDPNKMSIAFSFDDGPNGDRTKKLISYLEDYKMSASFFILGERIISAKDVVNTVISSHSEVGYHSYSHVAFTKEDLNQIKDEFKKANDALYQISGTRFKITRPPYGLYDKNTLKTIDNPLIRWDVDTNDWRYKDSDYIYNWVIDNMHDGAIILFHDSYDTTVEAVKRLLPKLYEMDVQVMSVTELARLKGVSLKDHEVYYSFTS